MARPQQREDDDDDLGLSSDELDDEQRQGGGGGSQQLAAAFGAASDWVAGAVSSGNTAFTDAVKLQFYGLYKQATAGVCTAPQPAFWNRAARLKWCAPQLHVQQCQCEAGDRRAALKLGRCGGAHTLASGGRAGAQATALRVVQHSMPGAAPAAGCKNS